MNKQEIDSLKKKKKVIEPNLCIIIQVQLIMLQTY